MLVPVILAGGSGSRLAPISTPDLPKPFLDLLDCGESLFELTLKRAKAASNSLPIIVCAKEHQTLVETALLKQRIKAHILLEPTRRNTAPAIACSVVHALQQYGSNCQLLVMPADHYLPDIEYFSQRIQYACGKAEQDKLVVFSIPPTHAETAYGYIEQNQSGQFVSFHEKPNISTAEQFLATRNFFWNSGFFLFDGTLMLSELERYAAPVLEAAKQASHSATQISDTIWQLSDDFYTSPSISIDYAIMEQSQRLTLVRYDSAWSDLGTWPALYNIWPKDAQNIAYNQALGLSLVPSDKGYTLYRNGHMEADLT